MTRIFFGLGECDDMTKLVTIDFLPTQWTNDAFAAPLSCFSGVLRSHGVANKDHRSLGFAIVGLAHSHQREGIIQALDGWIVGSHAIRVSRLDHVTQ